MRVVQVNYAFDPTLASAADLLDRYATLTGWAEALARAGAEVATVQAFHSSANVTRMGLPYIFGDVAAVGAAAAAFRPDVVHVNGLGFPLGVWRLRRRLGPAPAFVVQDHADGPPRARGFRRAVRRRLMRAVDAFLFTSSEQAEPWCCAGLIRPPQQVFEIIEASTDVRPMPRDAARAASGVVGDPAILWIGRLNANKDPLTVLDGFERFAMRHPHAALTMIYGGGDRLDAVRSRVGTSPVLRDRVRLIGEVPHERVAAFCSAADVFVLGSRHEGSGYALLEALACGAVPVVTDIPPFRAIVGVRHLPMVSDTPRWCQTPPDSVRHLGRQGDPGVLWQTGDRASCADALERALAIPRARVIEHFERNLRWDAVGKRAAKIYEEAIRAKGSGIRDQGSGTSRTPDP